MSAGLLVISSVLLFFKVLQIAFHAVYLLIRSRIMRIHTEHERCVIGVYLSVLVSVNSVYYGRNDSQSLKIYYPYPSTDLYDNTFLFKTGREYIFCLYQFENVYPYKNLHPEQYADAFIMTANTEAAPVIDGKVFFDSQFINDNRQSISKPQTIPLNSVEAIIPDEIRSGDWFSCLEKYDYIKYIMKLFDTYR